MKGPPFVPFLASFFLLASSLFAGFGSTEVFLPAVGRIPGQGGAQFYTTVWATNLTSAPQTFTFQFLKAGQSNPSPASFEDTLQPGQTKVYENVVETKLGLTNALGAARITSSGEIFVSERIYNQEPGDDLGKTEGLFFAGVPKSFSISAGQSATIQGIDQGGSENFRYNFALIETGGGSADVNVEVFDGSGPLLGQRSFPLSPYEQIQPNIAAVVPSIATTNARITATVTDGDGSVLLAGAQLANESQDSSGFEMTFRDELLGGSPGGGGLTAVIHDPTLVGSGTGVSPLGVNPAGVVKSVNGLHGAVALAAGSNVTITPSGSTLTIASTGGGAGGLTLPFSGSTTGTATSFSTANAGTGDGIHGSSASTGPSGTGVYGSSHGTSGETGWAGVWGDSHDATAVQGTSFNDRGVLGITSSVNAAGGVEGLNRDADGVGVLGRTGGGSGITSFTGGGSTNAAIVGDGEAAGMTALGGTVGLFAKGVDAGLEASTDSVAITGYGVLGSGQLGVVGIGKAGGYGVYSQGNFGGTGAKYFVEPHPTDPAKEIRYVCLEGRESGTYFRGTGRIVNGFATIDVPDDFRMVTAPKGMTVVVTPVGEIASLAVVERSLDRIVIQGSKDVEFDYMVNGVRRAFERHEPITGNRDFVPASPNDPRFAADLPAESVRRLKANGTLNADGTVNLETAHRLGWDRQMSWKRAENEHAGTTR